MRTLVVLAALVGAVPETLVAQGLPFHTETGLTTAFEQRGVRSLGMFQARGDAEVFVAPLVLLPFAPHQRVATKVTLPLVYKRLEQDAGPGYSAAGLGDVALGVKWAFLVRDRRAGTTRLAVAASAALPTGSAGATFDNGGTVPPSLQLGNGAVSAGLTLIGTLVRGPWGISADLGHTRTAGHDGFRLGPATQYDLALGLRLPRHPQTIRTQTVQFYLEWNGSVTARSTQDGAALPSSGGHVAYLTPGVQWVVLPQLLLETSVQVPVIQDHNGIQPDFGVRPALGARFLTF